MNKVGFLLSWFWLVFILITKLFFYFNENLYTTPIILMESLILVVSLSCCLAFFLKENHDQIIRERENSVVTIALLFGVIFIFLVVAYGNVFKHIVAYDAITLYDARAKFMLAGENFTSMERFSSYDSAQPSYYWFHPPFTSIAHYFWYTLGFPLPVGTFYTLIWTLMAATIFFNTRRYLNLNASLAVVFMAMASPRIVNLSLVEYTNVPFALTLVVQFFAAITYLKKPTISSALLFASSAALSIWIRAVEPIWILLYIALFVILFKKSIERLPKYVIYVSILIPIITLASWNYLIHDIIQVGNTIISNAPTISNLFLGIFNGRMVEVVIALAQGWGYVYIAYLSLIILIAAHWKWCKKQDNSSTVLFGFSIILLTLLFYIASIYYVSFNEVWWEDVAKDSVPRATIFLVPIASLICVSLYRDFSYTIRYKNAEKIETIKNK